LPMLLFAPWLPTVWRWTHDLQQGHWMHPFGPRELVDAYAEYAGGYFALVATVTLAIVAAGSLSRASWLPLMLLALVPVVPSATLSLFVHPMFVRRYGIAAIGGLFARSLSKAGLQP